MKSPETTRAILEKIDRAIARADLSKVPPEKLLAVRLQYIEAMQRDAMPKRKPLKGGDIGTVLKAYIELINAVRAGELTSEQAIKENTILSGMAKAIETHELKDRIEEIERILNDDK